MAPQAKAPDVEASSVEVAALPLDITHRLQWTVSEVQVGKGSKRKTILRDISGEASSGTITAILGPSGGGKTTLLECVSLRNRNFKGALRFDDQPVTTTFFTSTAVVYQKTLLSGSLTVRELVTFHAISRMAHKFSRAQIQQRVDEVLKEVRLTKCADTVIGSIDPVFTLKGISGGEAKRLALALELLHCPAVIILDEPTSGLDSVMSESVVQTLRDLASAGRIIITTLHCPSTFVMETVDSLVLLTHNGRLAYHGPRASVIKHFARIGYEQPVGISVSDHLLKVLSLPEGGVLDAEEEARISSVVEAFEQCDYAKAITHLPPDDAHRTCRGVGGVRAGLWTLFKLNLWRGATDLWRQIGLTAMLWAVSIMTDVLLGVLYYRQAYQNGRNLMGVAFALTNAILTIGAFAMVVYIPQEFAVLRREVLSGVNTPLPFLMSKLVLSVPLCIGPVVGAALLYWMTGMVSELSPFLSFLGVVFTMQAASFLVGALACAIASDLMTSIAVMPGLITPMIIFAGLLYDRASTPWYLVWIEKISLINYSFSSIVILQAPYLLDQSGLLILQGLGLRPDELTHNVWMMYAVMAGGFVLGYIALKLRFTYTNVVL